MKSFIRKFCYYCGIECCKHSKEQEMICKRILKELKKGN